MSVVIRRATHADAADVARIHVQSWQETYHGLMPQPFLDALDITQRAARWKTHLQDPSAFPVFVALVDGEPCGIAGAGAPPQQAAPYDAEIHLLYVLGAAQGKGLGRALMRAAAASLAAGGLKRPMLWVAAANDGSRGFYAHMGGKEFARKTEAVAGSALEQVGYGWEDMSAICPVTRPSFPGGEGN
ncbi:Acyl-CoA N-acyltransferase [Cordyceps fumosorosea ARSEF 2679]|uniref:Acyl-CoA N-acyltransferase n=1 Tax=Cordyceps fumosorosea (strain ARSEF 2679) TaxID=1081104 RepID=A0A162MPU8_CORFA|nr:Acyl-CoA N-acyltransferase [Cordyceps fumosorosea ARSEF 2679]OAA65040.1 Acyl-CoA N-acyltransferase [Cordyceps fumosorosea ARSEF 2679]